MLPILSACNNEDDVVEIFVGKTWKLARLTNDGSKAQFYEGIWKSNADMEKSLERLYEQPASFTITFIGSEIDGEIMGTEFKGNGVSSTFTGTWKADGSSQTLQLTLKVTGTENDPLAKVFINGLQKVSKYEGDSNSLTLHYKDESGTPRVIGLTPQR